MPGKYKSRGKTKPKRGGRERKRKTMRLEEKREWDKQEAYP